MEREAAPTDSFADTSPSARAARSDRAPRCRSGRVSGPWSASFGRRVRACPLRHFDDTVNGASGAIPGAPYRARRHHSRSPGGRSLRGRLCNRRWGTVESAVVSDDDRIGVRVDMADASSGLITSLGARRGRCRAGGGRLGDRGRRLVVDGIQDASMGSSRAAELRVVAGDEAIGVKLPFDCGAHLVDRGREWGSTGRPGSTGSVNHGPVDAGFLRRR